MDKPIPGPIADVLPNPPRLDREDTYVGILLSLWFSGLGIALLPIGTGAVGTLDPVTQELFALAMMVGTTISLAGSILGPGELKLTKPVRWVLKRILGWRYTPMPLRHCYRLGGAGLFGCCMSLLAFSLVLLREDSLVGTFTGLISPILLVCWTRKGRRLLGEARRMDRDYKRIMGEMP